MDPSLVSKMNSLESEVKELRNQGYLHRKSNYFILLAVSYSGQN